ncbi:hypothetical protein PF002_g24646 [Phytophthora fragariae]|uniref:Uncharacterized protein n=1 Tax=Phytophthora fragariae TaxID=53985 RepID=A0A6A3WTM8_9STRA|nr:hypothetical protein PF009_g24478 [Phytophthora fragariae]KAE9078775.1 hypothetical protein PF007_g23709 [Phytophthora fragariae]KAE9190902.1 hypothetical protein PF002_g24646 [Phytophthora fragariae]KAE9283440.1 hypothetical protein PF001_g22849 [Phytophthora fragariae]
MVGFAYGKAEGPVTRGGNAKVKLVRSRRWMEEEAESVELSFDELFPRSVSAEEALDGAGTFVGGVICTSRVGAEGTRVWEYGLVVGYRWEKNQKQGWLDVNVRGSVVSIVYSASCTQDIAVEVYALQPCYGRSTSLVMFEEVKQMHEHVYKLFNGVDGAAVRDIKVLLSDMGGRLIDESDILPLLDITSFEVVEVSIEHILDYVYYKEGERFHPSGKKFGDTIFDIAGDQAGTDAGSGSRGTEVVLSDGLSDSGDGDNAPSATVRRPSVTTQSDTKRRRLNAPDAAPAKTTTEISQLEQDVDTLISLQRRGLEPISALRPGNRQETVSSDKNQFNPTGMQSSIHLALVTSKYATMTAQQFVEIVQIYWRKFGFFPHPAVLRALFGWDFGMRGLSILHFIRVMEQEKRDRVRRSDMSIFSRKNNLPMPPKNVEFSELMGAVEVLCTLTQQLYKPVVHETLAAATQFLRELRVSEIPTSQVATAEIAAWIDDRLELFRVLIAGKDWTEVAKINSHFSAAHESFVRVHQLILRRDLIASIREARAGTTRHDQRPRENSHSEKRVAIPADVRNALPKQANKELYLRFLSAQGCRGKNGNCFIKKICHFKPAVLPDNVRDFITSNHGGLSENMQ